MVIEFQNERDLPGILIRPGLQKSQRRRVGVAAGIDGQLKMIERTVSSWIGSKTPGRAMLEPLVYGQNHQLASPRQFSMAQQTGDIRSCSRVVAAVPAQDLLNSISHVSPPVNS